MILIQKDTQITLGEKYKPRNAIQAHGTYPFKLILKPKCMHVQEHKQKNFRILLSY